MTKPPKAYFMQPTPSVSIHRSRMIRCRLLRTPLAPRLLLVNFPASAEHAARSGGERLTRDQLIIPGYLPLATHTRRGVEACVQGVTDRDSGGGVNANTMLQVDGG